MAKMFNWGEDAKRFYVKLQKVFGKKHVDWHEEYDCLRIYLRGGIGENGLRPAILSIGFTRRGGEKRPDYIDISIPLYAAMQQVWEQIHYDRCIVLDIIPFTAPKKEKLIRKRFREDKKSDSR